MNRCEFFVRVIIVASVFHCAGVAWASPPERIHEELERCYGVDGAIINERYLVRARDFGRHGCQMTSCFGLRFFNVCSYNLVRETAEKLGMEDRFVVGSAGEIEELLNKLWKEEPDLIEVVAPTYPLKLESVEDAYGGNCVWVNRKWKVEHGLAKNYHADFGGHWLGYCPTGDFFSCRDTESQHLDREQSERVINELLAAQPMAFEYYTQEDEDAYRGHIHRLFGDGGGSATQSQSTGDQNIRHITIELEHGSPSGRSPRVKSSKKARTANFDGVKPQP